jgi:hypothetical protein
VRRGGGEEKESEEEESEEEEGEEEEGGEEGVRRGGEFENIAYLVV